MKNILFHLALVAVFSRSACASPTSISLTQPSNSDQVATVVAATTQALPFNTPTAPNELLPHALYYLGRDNNNGLTQVFAWNAMAKQKQN